MSSSLFSSFQENTKCESSFFADTCTRRVPIFNSLSTIYNMSGRVVSDIQTRAEGESLYIRYNTAAHVVNST